MSLAEENIPLAQMIARQVWLKTGKRAELEDLMQDAMVGLVRAAQSFDPDRGIKFTTFASRRIAGEIYDSLRRNMAMSRTLYAEAKRIAAAEREFHRRHGREPESDEIAAELGVQVDDYHQARAQAIPPMICSIEHLFSDDDLPISEALADSQLKDPDNRVLASHARRCIALFEPREREIMRLYFDEEMRMKDIGALVGLSEPRISQIVNALIGRLRLALTATPTPAVN